ncbi:MAG: MoxR family ATPase [Nocardioides sp.]
MASVAALTDALSGGGYLADRGLATTLFVALSLDRPVLLEGEVGVGKTEVAKALAAVLGRRLIRLQCYEGIDTNQALYEWDYARQMLQIRALSERHLDDDSSVDALFGPRFLIERRCWTPSAPATGRSCSSTRWTAPTTSSRRSCWSCCRTSRSRSPRSAPSRPSGRRW